MRTLQEFRESIGAVIRSEILDELSKQVWVGLARASFTEQEAQMLSEAIQARRVLLQARRQPPAIKSPLRRSKGPTGPSISRRRGWAASGAMPPQIASHFTSSEAAALSVIARAYQRGGICDWPIDKIAAIAGCSRTSVQNALREAKRLGLISVQERRHRGRSSETNLVKVVSPEWLVWLRLNKGSAKGGGSGFNNLSSTNKNFKYTYTKSQIQNKPPYIEKPILKKLHHNMF